MSSEKAYIAVEGLTLKTPAGRVFSDATFAVEQGQVCALFGTEGSGKTALALCLAGRMRITGGTATVADFDVNKKSRKIRAISNISIIHRINDVPENLKVKDIAAAELKLNGTSGRKDKVDALLAQWDFADIADVRYRDLNSYDKILFGIMLACCGGQELIFVDDIQTGVTQHQSIKLVKLFRRLAEEQGTTVVFGCSEYEIVRYADCMVLMSAEAAEQRRAVMEQRGISSDIPVVGSANGVGEVQ